MDYTVRELSVHTYPDFEKLASKQGNCWCTYYQRAKPVPGVHGEELKRVNRKFKKALLKNDKSHAMLVYSGDLPVGWCQYGVKDELPRIDAGRGYKKLSPLDTDKKLWRITCFFTDRAYRGKGVSKFALKAALESIKKQGGGVVEAYPVVSKKMTAVAEWRWFGTPRMFEREGFKQVGPLGTSWVLMRKIVSPQRTRASGEEILKRVAHFSYLTDFHASRVEVVKKTQHLFWARELAQIVLAFAFPFFQYL